MVDKSFLAQHGGIWGVYGIVRLYRWIICAVFLRTWLNSQSRHCSPTLGSDIAPQCCVYHLDGPLMIRIQVEEHRRLESGLDGRANGDPILAYCRPKPERSS